MTLRILAALVLAAVACRSHAASRTAPPDPWAVRLDGIGPILYGMAVADARAALGDTLGDPTPTDRCVYLVPAGVPPGLRFMAQNGRIVRADVESTGVRTEAGGEVGMSEADVRSRYPAAVVRPHKYDSAGRYLIVRDTTDSSRRLVFETDGQRVVRYRGGVMPPVEYVEGCG
jgi:hypothetical protein